MMHYARRIVMKGLTGIRLFGAALLMLLLAQPLLATGTQETAAAGATPATTQAYSFFIEDTYARNDAKIAEMEKRFNLKLDMIVTPRAEYDQKLNLAMAAREIPDIILFRDMNQMFSYAQQGALLPIDGLLKGAPHSMAYIPNEVWQYTRVNGKTYVIPTWRIREKYNMYVRKDWLDKLNLPIPRTLEEFHAVMKAFVEKDPNGTGANDTYGFASSAAQSLAGIGTFAPFYGAFGVMDGAWYYDDKTRQVLPYDISPAMKDALAYIARMYAEKLVVQDWMVIKGAQADAYIDSSKVGLFYGFWSYPARRDAKIKTMVPGVEIVPIAPPVGPTGIKGNRADPYIASRTFALSVNIKNPERAIEFLDYFHSVDGMLFGRYGIEGANWNWAPGTTPPKTLEELNQRIQSLVLTDQYQAELKTTSYGFFNLYQPQQKALQMHGVTGLDLASLTGSWDQPVIRDYSDGILSDVKTKYQAALNTLRDEAFTKIIMGEWPISRFEEYVRTWKAQGGDLLIKDLNEKYAKIAGN
jgi:putative aldouronate transport system substrate-binding protein